MALQQEPAYLDRPNAPRLAYLTSPGRAPTVVFLSGFMSDMTGAKASALAAFCADRGQAFLRFDYRGHGASEGVFADCGIEEWREDALAVIDRLTDGPVILVGSSMGGWISLLAALARPERIAGLIGLAAAPDFTEELIWQQLDSTSQQKLMSEGAIYEPSAYGEMPYCFSRKLIEGGRRHLLLGGPIPLQCPVRLLQGMADVDVPFVTAMRIAERLESTDVVVSLIKDADHRLSRDSDLGRLCQMVAEVSGLIRARMEPSPEAAP